MTVNIVREQRQVTIPGHGAVTTVATYPADLQSIDWQLVYAPGAGSNVHDPFGAHLSHALAEQGMAALAFQFPYAEARKRRPDPTGVLEETWHAVVEEAREEGARLVLGGRSMGGRIASQVVAKGTRAEALALFAYPLHPPGRPDKMRDQHLPAIEVPTLFCSGTRDAFATPEELAEAASKVRLSSVHLLQGADHGFSVPRSTGRTRNDVWMEATSALLQWLRQLDSEGLSS